jgi:hypothetical protein
MRHYFKLEKNLKIKKYKDAKRNKIKRETKRILLELELNEYSNISNKIDDLSKLLAAKV